VLKGKSKLPVHQKPVQMETNCAKYLKGQPKACRPDSWNLAGIPTIMSHHTAKLIEG
jgi:hypothetical protein